MVRLNFGPEVELKTVVDYVSQRLGINILYDEIVLDQKVSIRASADIPVSSLLPLLRSALKMKNLALEEATVPGWKQIVSSSQMTAVAPLSDEPAELLNFDPGMAVTHIFVLRYADANEVHRAIEPFLTRPFLTQTGAALAGLQPGANSLPLPDQGVLVVTDYASNIRRIARLVSLMDVPQLEARIEFIPLHHTGAADLTTQVRDLLSTQSASSGRPGAPALPAPAQPRQVRISGNERTNQLIVVGTSSQIETVRQIVQALDVPSEEATRPYPLEFASAARAAELIQTLLDEQAVTSRFRAAVDTDNNQLLVTGPESVHQRIRALIKSVDKEPSREQSPIRFYKLENVAAYELLETLRSLREEDSGGFGYWPEWTGDIRGVSGGIRAPYGGPYGGAYPGGLRSRSGAPFVPGPNRPAFPGRSLPSPPATRGFEDTSIQRGQQPDTAPQPAPDTSQLLLPAGEARITADQPSNSLIIVAEPETQRVYQQLIRTLDQRRPQVLIEAKLVIIDTTDEFELGVEVSGGDRSGLKRLFAFTSYGLSNVNPISGALTIIPGTGFNGTLVDPDVADAVVRALTRHSRARVVSAPRLLVNDNALGVLTSVDEQPFSSVNASNVVATTSFAGFAEAGTTIEVTPHVSSNDYLQLEYRIILNSFTGTGSEGIPPPRKTDEIESVVTIPDGHTVIVGGLNQRDYADSSENVPFVEYVPVLKYLTGVFRKRQATSSLFVFVRPIILRDDKFRSLKFFSEKDIHRAQIPPDYPGSRPVLIR